MNHEKKKEKKEKKNRLASQIERVILSAGAMLIFSYKFLLLVGIEPVTFRVNRVNSLYRFNLTICPKASN